MKHIMRATVQTFVTHNPGEPGSAPLTVYDGEVERPVDLWPVLAFVEGDIPFMGKFSKACGHSAICGCQRCGIRGDNAGSSSAVKCVPQYAWVENASCGVDPARECLQGSSVTSREPCASYMHASIAWMLCCRWFGYDKERKQALPCYHNEACEMLPNTEGHQYPAGLLTPDETVPRDFWTLDDTIVPDTWATGKSVKFSESELTDRAEQGDHQARLAALQFPMTGADGNELHGKAKMAMYDKFATYLNDKHLDLGCKGTPVFASLSYFRCAPLIPCECVGCVRT